MDLMCDEMHVESEIQESELCILMIKAFPLKEIYALMGEEKVQIKLKEFLFRKNKMKHVHAVSYLLMIFEPMSLDLLNFERNYQHERYAPFAKQNIESEEGASYKSKPASYKIRQATICDASSLLPLQIAYEKEEVCISPKKIPPYISMINLQKILKNEIVYITTLDELPIAKANTNARSINYFQLGGIYTMPKYRRHGIASLTVSALMQHICKVEKKKIALFVNIKNIAAVSLYKKLGFMDVERLMISYFK